MEDALVVGAVAEERHDHLIAAFELDRERGADRERHGGADDAVRAQDVELQVGHVHRAAEAPAIAGLAPHELGHHAVGAGALGDAVAMAAVVARDVVVVAQMRAGADRDRLLADVAVRGALDRARLELLDHALLEGADAHHVGIEALQLRRRQLQVGVMDRASMGNLPPARLLVTMAHVAILATAVGAARPACNLAHDQRDPVAAPRQDCPAHCEWSTRLSPAWAAEQQNAGRQPAIPWDRTSQDATFAWGDFPRGRRVR